MKTLRMTLLPVALLAMTMLASAQSTIAPGLRSIKSEAINRVVSQEVQRVVAAAISEKPAPTVPTPEAKVSEAPKSAPAKAPEPKTVPITVKDASSAWSAMTVGVRSSLDIQARVERREQKGVVEGAQREVAVQISDWALSEVLASLSAQTGVNVVLVAEKNPKITVKLERMPLDEVVRILASMSGNGVVGIRGGYVLGPVEVIKNAFPTEWAEQSSTSSELMANEQVIDTYTCKHVDPGQLAEALKSVFSDEKLKADVGPGKLRPEDLDANAGSSNSGSSSNPGTNPGGGAMGFSNSGSGSKGRLLVLRGPRVIVRQALQLAARLDLKQPQVGIQVEILDISNDALNDLGVSWQQGTTATLNENSPRGINFGSFDRDPLRITASIRHLESTGKAKVLAKPNLSLLDQERGYILIGSRINYPVVVSVNDNGQPIFDIKEERVGIYMQVAASINEDNEVTLSLYPQVSTITGFLTVNDASYPQVSTREARTSLRVKSGQTVALGGLITDEEIKSVERVPILSKIPLFGELFTRRKTTTKSSQVVIFITPIVEPIN